MGTWTEDAKTKGGRPVVRSLLPAIGSIEEVDTCEDIINKMVNEMRRLGEGRGFRVHDRVV